VGGPISRLGQIHDGSQPPFWKKENCHNSAAVSDIFTKFGAMVDVDSPQRAVTSFLTSIKIQDGGQLPF